MKRYERYKPSKVEWIGEIPEHWEAKKLKYCFDFVTGFTPSSGVSEYYDGKYIWITIADMTNKYLNDSKQYITDEAIKDCNAIVVPKGSLLYSFKLSIGKVAFADVDLYTNEAIIAILENDKINLNYLYYSLPKQVIYNANENIYGAKLLNQDLIKNAFIVTPSIDEQKLIANYLDKKTAEIEELIADKVNLISLLEQEKELTISNAVTKGLNPNVPMKDSKVKWVGEIPEHWSLRKISHSFNTIGSGTTPLTSNSAYYTNGTIPWINTGDLNNDYLLEVNKTVSTFAVEDNSALKIYPKYSLVIAMYGATIGKIGITTFDACANQACCILAGSDYFTLRYIYYWFIANKKYIIDLGYGGGQPNISQEIIKSLRIPCPLIEEQEQIVEYLDKKIAATNEAVQIIKDEIELLKEYKETLIYEVITGKIDVRNIS